MMMEKMRNKMMVTQSIVSLDLEWSNRLASIGSHNVHCGDNNYLSTNGAHHCARVTLHRFALLSPQRLCDRTAAKSVNIDQHTARRTCSWSREMLRHRDTHSHHHHLHHHQHHHHLLRLLLLFLLSLLPNLLSPTYTLLLVNCDPIALTSSTSSLTSSSSSAATSSPAPPPPTAAALLASPPSPSSSTSAAVNFRCPEQFGYYADEYNCSKYFVCVFGEALHESCTGGLRFSSELQTCDWPRNVVCPSEDLGYDDDEVDGNEAHLDSSSNIGDISGGHISKSSSSSPSSSSSSSSSPPTYLGSGMVREVTPTERNAYSSHPFTTPTMASSSPSTTTTTPMTPTPFFDYSLSARFMGSGSVDSTAGNNDDDTSAEQQINEAALQESFDKLVKNSIKNRHQANLDPSPPSSSITYRLVKSANQQPQQQQQQPIRSNRLNQDHHHQQQHHDFHDDSHNRQQFGESDLSDIEYGIGGSRDHNIIISNNLEHANRTAAAKGDHLSRVEDLDENFTLVDLQRARVTFERDRAVKNSPSGVGRGGKPFDDNNLGTIGRSVSGVNRAQSVSVIASTSSEAIIPELDFVFRNTKAAMPSKKVESSLIAKKPNPKPNKQLSGHFRPSSSLSLSSSSADRAPKFDDTIATIGLDENGSINFDSDNDDDGDEQDESGQVINSGARSLRISSPAQKQLSTFNVANALPGTAASNRNTASQQIAIVAINKKSKEKDSNIKVDDYADDHADALVEEQNDNDHHRRHHSQRMSKASKPSKISIHSATLADTAHPDITGHSTETANFGSDLIKSLKSGSGTILVFNRTQLITVARDHDGDDRASSLVKHEDDNGVTNDNGNNSSSTFILIDHQQPTATVLDGRQRLLSSTTSAVESNNDRNKPIFKSPTQLSRPLSARRPLTASSVIVRPAAATATGSTRSRNFVMLNKMSNATSTANTGQHIGSKERTNKPSSNLNLKQSTQTTASVTTATTQSPASSNETSSSDEDDEDLVDLLVQFSPASEIPISNDFQRLHRLPNNNGEARNRSTLISSVPVSAKSVKYHLADGQPKSNNKLLRSNNSTTTATTTSGGSSAPSRVSQARRIGTHHRATNSNNAVLPKSSHARTSKQYLHNIPHYGNVSLQIPARPPSLYGIPEPFTSATKCNDDICKLPDCFCGGTKIPGAFEIKDIPQLVLISFDDAVNDVNWDIYEELLNSGRSNPNGCPIKATFYVSHEWTDYSKVQTLYSRGHEIASHSITHTFGELFSKQQWKREIGGQREILHLYGGVNRADIRGMRAPFLQGGGNKQFEMLHEENFTYDSSMSVFENSPPFWPYTMDYAMNHDCMIAPCPTKSYPGLWEIGLVMWQDLLGRRCSMADGCLNPSDENGVYEMIMKNFKRHYDSNRAPFGLYYHSSWFNTEHHRRGFLRVIDDLLAFHKDVYFVTKWELIQWIRNPSPLKELYRVNLFTCSRDPHRPSPCMHPNICNVNSHSGASRFFKTCQPCPKRYPWLGDDGRH